MTLITRTLGAGYGTKAEVRRISGVPVADVSDNDLDDIIVKASIALTDIIATRVESQPLYPTASRTSFSMGVPYVADLNVDSLVNASDVNVRFVRTNPTTGLAEEMSPGVVTLTSARYGTLSTTVALPEGWEAVADFGYYSRPLDLTRAALAVNYLAAHMAVLRMKAPGRITRADTLGAGDSGEKGALGALAAMRTKYLALFEREVAAMRGQAVF